jgi:hypothetical protein
MPQTLAVAPSCDRRSVRYTDLMKTPQSLRLSLRELFLLVALVATGMGWHREYQIAAPIRDACRTLEPDISKHQMAIAQEGGEYRGVHFWVSAVTHEYRDARGALPDELGPVKDLTTSPASPPAN